ncbi:NAD(P)/FAD-dependent oxidoreductase [Nocardioides abyssi]|uniref:NAD(P)/FAD-dependent oxidoreductase n=1 Tax=Nocardioides abyssi TaxID=3058370 RepID=A0ABT8ES98_9ACTN|nr:NAD(P)/FAD-dependent oxidoreductase [Nocardioides abyssi]MDN4161038.1 NAD(P)/FAD-dependent oxidoreductase [Nocardioides abyssi]
MDNSSRTSAPATHDVVVIGGGPAGLQAALTLGRVHRSVLLLDSGSYRNATVDAMHNFLSHDGTPPADLRAAVHAELAAYPTVEVRAVAATRTRADGAAYAADLADGTSVTARGLVLATGLRDALPDKPGLADLWGREAAHCPFCHGHEYAGRPVAVLGGGPAAGHLTRIMAPVASRLTVLADGAPLEADLPAGVDVRPEPVAGFCRSAGGATVTFADGSTEDYAGVFVVPVSTQAAPFAEQLGLALLPSGGVEVDVMGRTSLPRVHAAGDMAHVAALPMPVASVLVSAAAGQVAAASMVAALL